MKTLILGNAHPIGEVQDFKYRIEFQQRGSPNAHMVIWVRGAPELTEESVQDVRTFIDKYVSYQYNEDKPELNELVNSSQRHSHTFTCRKNGSTCRFSFPRPPLPTTQIFFPSVDNAPATPAEQIQYQLLLAQVQLSLSEQRSESQDTLDDILTKLNATEEQYIKALKCIKTKNGHPAILYQRKPPECFINNYNSYLLTASQPRHSIYNKCLCLHYVHCILYEQACENTR